jgi:LysR family nitrogen assimilation transcriptional regulator
MPGMDLKQLETFVQVAELGSFTRAAAVLHVAQPALSRQVRALEVELRQPLFDRNGRGVTLTEAGKRLLAHGRGILAQVQRAREDLETQRGAASGRLAIALPPSVSRTLTGPLVAAFREQFPQATLSLVEGLSTYALEWLALGRVDMAVVYNMTPGPTVQLQPVLEEALYLVSARQAGGGTGGSGSVGRPVTLAQVAALPLVMPNRPHSIRMLVESTLAGAALQPRIALEIDSVPAILDLVERQHLHAVLSLNALRGRELAFTARPVALGRGKAPLAARLWLATSAQRPGTPLMAQGQALVAQMLHRHLV